MHIYIHIYIYIYIYTYIYIYILVRYHCTAILTDFMSSSVPNSRLLSCGVQRVKDDGSDLGFT